MKFNYQTTNDPDGFYEIFGGVDDTEEYRTNPIATGLYCCVSKDKRYHSGEILGVYLPAQPAGRYGWYINGNSTETQVILSSSGRQNCGVRYKPDGSSETSQGQIPVGTWNNSYQKEMAEKITMNVPIFDTYANKDAYVTASTDEEALQILREHAINYKLKCYIGCM